MYTFIYISQLLIFSYIFILFFVFSYTCTTHTFVFLLSLLGILNTSQISLLRTRSFFYIIKHSRNLALIQCYYLIHSLEYDFLGCVDMFSLPPSLLYSCSFKVFVLYFTVMSLLFLSFIIWLPELFEICFFRVLNVIPSNEIVLCIYW